MANKDSIVVVGFGGNMVNGLFIDGKRELIAGTEMRLGDFIESLNRLMAEGESDG
jgi:hypothetical protein